MCMKRFIYSLLLCVSTLVVINAQPANDDCFTPIELNTNLGQFCTEVGELSNIGATLSDVPLPPNWPPNNNMADIWISFRASAQAATFTITGATNFMPGGTMTSPQMALYVGVCGNLTEVNSASDGLNVNSLELTVDGLIPGQRYYLRISARQAIQGTFQLCINSFQPAPSPEADCADAVLLCDQTPFTVERLVGTGADVNEIGSLGLCLPDELASSWYKWICEDPGTLTFVLTPNNPADDLDFILFELPDGLDDCANKSAIRCMASGENVDQPPGDWVRCTGPTGLRLGDPDLVEGQGCAEPSNNNFLKEVDMVAGRAYALMINNFSESGQGFSIEFGGTGTFVGPKAEINIVDGQTLDSIECDKTFTLQETINFPSGSITSIDWQFGVDAIPSSVTGGGPHNVTYSSIGKKTITLALKSDRGCFYYETLEIDVAACCDDIVGYNISLDSVTNLICAGVPTGEIAVSGNGGEPFYEFSLNGDLWQFNDLFQDLPAGDYDVFIRDRKGCQDTLRTTLTEPEPLMVDAGPDQVIGLGCPVLISATVVPGTSTVVYKWSSTDTAFMDPAMASFTTFPPGEATYTVMVSDDAGCEATDEVLISSDGLRPVFIPNAFSPNNDGINDFFTVFSNKATREIISLQVFDRWGGKVFEQTNFPTNEVTMGWDGTANGQILNPGTYAYVAKVLFVDGVEMVYHGDINLIK